jgi:hypothetical protein
VIEYEIQDAIKMLEVYFKNHKTSLSGEHHENQLKPN